MSAAGNQGKVYPLTADQALAVDPQDNVWLSASAGTGKTQVLSARVLRLLLRDGVDPSNILCLTFTKAGAAEMATRVSAVLANWVRMKPDALAKDLKAIGAPHGPAALAKARTLFASVLDCPGGGLRIDTIHAFSQWLLAAFPQEAGLVPGTRPMEDRDRDLLARQVLAQMVADWEEQDESALTESLEQLSIRLGPDGVRSWLTRCADARDMWFGPGAWQEPVADRVKQLLGLEASAGPEAVAKLCSDQEFAVASLRRCGEVAAEWGAKSGLGIADAVAEWLACDPAGRAASCDDLRKALLTQKGDPQRLSSLEKIDPSYGSLIAEVGESIARVTTLKTLFEMVDWLTPALTAGRRFALRWDEAKTREGLIDFDDQIRRAARLLKDPEVAEWIRYKLDRSFDHILIDEAQDTNEAQWDIIDAVTGDFFTGEGQRQGRLRTVFAVGDYKQAIFGFQGTSPENFDAARRRYRGLIDDYVRNAKQLARETRVSEPDVKPLQELGLDRSYRTVQPVLDFVDAAIEAIGHDQIGLKGVREGHKGFDRKGQVTLWQPISSQSDDEGEEAGPEDWISEPERRMADRIALQVKQWLDEGYPLVKDDTNPRNAGPGDIMVLVRKRRELAGLIVARLYAAGVPVAGVDRLRLGAPLAVQDVMATLRFAAQPLDDLSLACLLVSPLFGWSQDDLLEHGYRGDKVRLWHHLRDSDAPDVKEAVAKLRDLLRLADFEPPEALLRWILLGPWQGRMRLTARLGAEANDPLDELLNAAHAYSAAHTPSLTGFIAWFDAGNGELKREAEGSGDLVRVMTVHGSKGLQAPVVILADATSNPDNSRASGLKLEEGEGTKGRKVPIPSLRKEERVGTIAAAEEEAKAAERAEHWRLLYVAMTRAEEALFIGGALGKREKEPAQDSWYARLAPLMTADPVTDGIWGARSEWGERPPPVAAAKTEKSEHKIELPDWVRTPIGPEPQPPRPLAPSSAGEEGGSNPPLPPEVAKNAARRGVVIHRLLERLPDIAKEERRSIATKWLKRQADSLSEAEQAEMLVSALAVLDDPQFAALFSPASLAEVPLAATVGGQVIAGFADRLLVEEDRVLVVDYKTARKPPQSLEEVPASARRQMAAYAAALGEIYPGRQIEAALLYTQTPQLIAIPPDVLAAEKDRLQAKQESFAAAGVE